MLTEEKYVYIVYFCKEILRKFVYYLCYFSPEAETSFGYSTKKGKKIIKTYLNLCTQVG
jgi:hypothetical protein